MPCCLVQVHTCFARKYGLHFTVELLAKQLETIKQQAHRSTLCLVLVGLHFSPEDGGSTCLTNVGEFKPGYIESHARRQNSVLISLFAMYLIMLSAAQNLLCRLVR
jgi:hypothetical protein